MASRNTSDDSPLENRAAVRVGDRANDAKDAMWDAAHTATKKVDEGRLMAADQLENAASTVHERANDLPGGQGVRDFAHAAADRLSTTADYMRTHDTKRMMADVETVVKNNPGPALLIAAAFGFVLGRSLTRG